MMRYIKPRLVAWLCVLAQVPLVFVSAWAEMSGRAVPWWYPTISGIAILSLIWWRGVLWYARRSARRAALKRRRSVTAPENVRIETADGRVIRCGYLRDPDGDADGHQAWLVIPLENYRVRPGDDICSDGWPPDAIIRVPMVGGEGLYGCRDN